MLRENLCWSLRSGTSIFISNSNIWTKLDYEEMKDFSVRKYPKLVCQLQMFNRTEQKKTKVFTC